MELRQMLTGLAGAVTWRKAGRVERCGPPKPVVIRIDSDDELKKQLGPNRLRERLAFRGLRLNMWYRKSRRSLLHPTILSFVNKIKEYLKSMHACRAEELVMIRCTCVYILNHAGIDPMIDPAFHFSLRCEFRM